MSGAGEVGLYHATPHQTLGQLVAKESETKNDETTFALCCFVPQRLTGRAEQATTAQGTE